MRKGANLELSLSSRRGGQESSIAHLIRLETCISTLYQDLADTLCISNTLKRGYQSPQCSPRRLQVTGLLGLFVKWAGTRGVNPAYFL